MSRFLDVAQEMADVLYETSCSCYGVLLCRRCSALQGWVWWLQDQRDDDARIVLIQDGLR